MAARIALLKQLLHCHSVDGHGILCPVCSSMQTRTNSELAHDLDFPGAAVDDLGKGITRRCSPVALRAPSAQRRRPASYTTSRDAPPRCAATPRGCRFRECACRRPGHRFSDPAIKQGRHSGHLSRIFSAIRCTSPLSPTPPGPDLKGLHLINRCPHVFERFAADALSAGFAILHAQSSHGPDLITTFPGPARSSAATRRVQPPQSAPCTAC